MASMAGIDQMLLLAVICNLCFLVLACYFVWMLLTASRRAEERHLKSRLSKQPRPRKATVLPPRNRPDLVIDEGHADKPTKEIAS